MCLRSGLSVRVKAALLLVLAAAAVSLTACTTLENRRDMYSPQTVNGPYTRMLKDGIPSPQPVSGTVTTTTVSAGSGK